jgi:two-component system CheB/CheR fusion protein
MKKQQSGSSAARRPRAAGRQPAARNTPSDAKQKGPLRPPPAKIAKAAKTAKPAKPTKMSKPAKPATIAKPAKIAKPEKIAKPAKLATPTKNPPSAQPGQRRKPTALTAAAADPQADLHEALGGRPSRQSQARDNASSPEDAGAVDNAPPFLIAAVGASAGGLEAVRALIKPIPGDADLALVLAQHLARGEESHLAEVLARDTQLTVVQAHPHQRIEPRHIYVIPPDSVMTVNDGHLELQPRPAAPGTGGAVDHLLSSVAQQYGEHGVAVILSGGGLDGAVGVREVKQAGGIVFAQNPEEAGVDGMPRAAISTGVVDAVLGVEKIADELVRLSRHSFFRDHGDRRAADELTRDSHLRRIFQLLRRSSGVDFSQYKLPTISRRIDRRIALNRIGALGEYAAYLQQNPGEVDALQEDLLIHVTSFFRDPESYDALRMTVLPAIMATRSPEEPIRAWVPGCSTGEEAYSIAITLLDFLGDKAATTPIQVFGTDVSERTVERARLGVYSETIAVDMPPDVLRRYFARFQGGYRINKSLRERCVFARQDITRDPPFSRLDLIVCRNLLIYLDQTAQRKVMGVFHYALKPTGYLALGRSETIGPHADLFGIADKRFKFYTKKRASVRPEVEFRAPISPGGDEPGRAALLPRPVNLDGHGLDFQNEVNRLLIDRYAPAGVVVDSDFRIIRSRGPTAAFLELPAGEASLDVLKMVRPGLLSGLRSALHEVRSHGATTRKENLRLNSQGQERVVSLEVTPVGPLEARHYLILFEDVRRTGGKALAKGAGARGKKGSDAVIKGLEDELAATREHLQSIIHDLAAANEELQSANEEILSSNEELQSTNEELDTAKEELQSTNEELSTLNDELQARNAEMNEINSDLVNLLASVQIPIVIVGSDLRIRRFTPAAERVLNLIASDIGRPIGHIKPNVVCPDLEALIQEVIETMTTRDRQVEDLDHKVYALRIRPYKNMESKLDGAVMTLFDITSLRDKDDARRSAQSTSDTLLASMRDPVLVLDHQLRVLRANEASAEKLGLGPARGEGSLAYELGGGKLWNVPVFKQLLEEVLSPNGTGEVRDYVLETGLAPQGARNWLLDARRFDTGTDPGIILTMREATT